MNEFENDLNVLSELYRFLSRYNDTIEEKTYYAFTLREKIEKYLKYEKIRLKTRNNSLSVYNVIKQQDIATVITSIYFFNCMYQIYYSQINAAIYRCFTNHMIKKYDYHKFNSKDSFKVFLIISDSTQKKSKRITTDDKELIIELMSAGFNNSEIERLTGVTRKTLAKYRLRYDYDIKHYNSSELSCSIDEEYIESTKRRIRGSCGHSYADKSELKDYACHIANEYLSSSIINVNKLYMDGKIYSHFYDYDYDYKLLKETITYLVEKRCIEGNCTAKIAFTSNSPPCNRKTTDEIECIKKYIKMGLNNSRIEHKTGITRKTVAKYRKKFNDSS